MSTLETLHDRGSRELANFIIDLEDEDCPIFHLHLAAYQGDIEHLTMLLEKDEFKKVINDCCLIIEKGKSKFNW